MKQLITQPRRVTETSKSLIDVIFTSNPAVIVDSGIVDWQYYQGCRNDVKRVLCEAEKEYVQNEVEKNQSSSARWKVIQNCIPTGRSRTQLILGIWKNLRWNLMNSLQRWEYVLQRKPKDSHQSMIWLLHIRNSLSVLYPKKLSFDFGLLPLLRSIGLYSHFLQIKHQGKINTLLYMAVVKDALLAILPILTKIILKQFTFDICISLTMERIWNCSNSKGWWRSGSSQRD